MTGANRVVLTTGATSGIGLETAVELARRGWVSVATHRSAAKRDVLLAAARSADVTVHPVSLDVTDAGRCAEAIEDIVAEHGRLDALVNNAGYGFTGSVEDTSDAEARQLVDTLLMAPARLSRLVLGHLRQSGGGTIVNVSSIYGRITTPLSGWYQASKHGLEALTDALRAEVAGDGIRVVLVEPGGFKTAIWDEEGVQSPSERYTGAYERSAKLLQMAAPLLGDPAACATVIAGALESRSPRARYLVGADARLAAVAMPFASARLKDRISRTVLGL